MHPVILGWYWKCGSLGTFKVSSLPFYLVTRDDALYLVWCWSRPAMRCHTSQCALVVLCCGIRYNDIIMSAMASQITSVTIVCSNLCSGADHRKHQSSGSLVFMRGIHRWPAESHHKGPVRQKVFPFDDVIMSYFAATWAVIRMPHANETTADSENTNQITLISWWYTILVQQTLFHQALQYSHNKTRNNKTIRLRCYTIPH